VLRRLLEWLVANGTEGVGLPDSKLALYRGRHGERGILCQWDCLPGEVLARVPLRLALADHPGDEESNALVYEGAPWSVRLACRLLRERARGAASPWRRYLDSLPAAVPSPLEALAWEDLRAVDYPPMQAALDRLAWLAGDAWQRLSPEATGGASREAFGWALSVVHSRTFGTPAADGAGVGVRMLVPLVDMLNHAGDQTRLRPRDPAAAQDHVEWRACAPGSPGNASGEWEMHVVALRPCEAGEEVLMSYGERANDDFFLHYGFVPDGNPHDAADLFAGTGELLDYAAALGGEGARGRAEAAVRAVEGEVSGAGEGHLLGGGGGGPGPGGDASDDPFAPGLKVLAGCRVDRRVTGALAAALGAGGPGAAERAVADRCLEVLGAFEGSLLGDLERLAQTPRESAGDAAFGESAEEVESDPEGAWRRGRWRAMLAHYHAAIGRFLEAGGRTPAEAAAASPLGPPRGAGAEGAAGGAGAAGPVMLEDPALMAEGLGIDLGALGVAPPAGGEGAGGAPPPADGAAAWDDAGAWSEEAQRHRDTATAYLAWKKALLWDFVIAAYEPPAPGAGASE